MDDFNTIEDLGNNIRESKPIKNTIIEGYQFSGKKYILYEILNSLNVASFSIVYHKNINLDETKLNNILKKLGIDVYELEDFDKNKDKIKGNTVFPIVAIKNLCRGE